MIMPICDPDIIEPEEFRLYHQTNTFLPEYVKQHNPSHIVVYSRFWDMNYEMRSFLEKEMNFVEANFILKASL